MDGKDNKRRGPEESGRERSMVETIVRRKKNWIGHIMRGDGLMKEVMEGKMERTR